MAPWGIYTFSESPMSQVKKTIPLHAHAAMSMDFKKRCARVYNRIRLADGQKDPRKDLPFKDTEGMSSRILAACVDFTSLGSLTPGAMIKPHLSTGLRKFLPHPQAHHKGCMDLRRTIAEPPFKAWSENHVHSWRDFNKFYESLSIEDKFEVDGFYKMLADIDFKSFVRPHAIEMDGISSTEPHEWVKSDYLKMPVRADLSPQLFSVAAGELISTVPNTSLLLEDFSTYPVSDFFDGFVHGGDNDYPYLAEPTELSPGVRFSSLADAITLAMSVGIQKGYCRSVTVDFMGEQILRASISDDGFVPEMISPIVNHTTSISKALILDVIEKAEPVAHTEARFDLLLAVDLGLDINGDEPPKQAKSTRISNLSDDLGL